MAFKRSGDYWGSVTADDFASASVEARYSIDGGADVKIADVNTTALYEDPEYPTEITGYSATYNWLIPEAAEGSNVIFKLVDTRQEEEPVEFGPYDIINPVATSVTISPQSTNVSIGSQRQFTATFLAADGLSTDTHDTEVWSVDGGGNIDEDTGLFTAGSEIGGPHTVTMEAGALNDTAEVNVIATSSIVILQSSLINAPMLTI